MMNRFSTSLKFACLSAVLVLGACTKKEAVTTTAPPPVAAPAPAPAPVTSSIIPGSAEDLRANVGDTVHFALDQYNVEEGDKAILGRQAAWLQRYPAVRVTIEGHADERGRHSLMLEGYGYRWYRVGGLDYLLKRSDIDIDASGKAGHPA